MNIEELISNYLDGELSSDAEGELHYRLAISPDDRKLFREMIALRSIARDQRVLHIPEPTLRTALFDRLKGEGMMPLPASSVATPASPAITAAGASSPYADDRPARPSELRRNGQTRRRRRLIPILLPLLLLLIASGVIWQSIDEEEPATIAQHRTPSASTKRPPTESTVAPESAEKYGAIHSSNDTPEERITAMAAPPAETISEPAVSSDAAVARPSSFPKRELARSSDHRASGTQSKESSVGFDSHSLMAYHNAPELSATTAEGETDNRKIASVEDMLADHGTFTNSSSAPSDVLSSNRDNASSPTFLGNVFSNTIRESAIGFSNPKSNAPALLGQVPSGSDSPTDSATTLPMARLSDGSITMAEGMTIDALQREPLGNPRGRTVDAFPSVNTAATAKGKMAVGSEDLRSLRIGTDQTAFEKKDGSITLRGSAASTTDLDEAAAVEHALADDEGRSSTPVNPTPPPPVGAITRHTEPATDIAVTSSRDDSPLSLERSRSSVDFFVGARQDVVVNARRGEFIPEQNIRIGLEMGQGSHQIVLLAGRSGFAQETTLISTGDRSSDVVHEIWGGVGYGYGLSIDNWMVGGNAMVGVGSRYMRAGIEAPVAYRLSRRVRIEITPMLQYTQLLHSDDEITTGTTQSVSRDADAVRVGIGAGVIIIIR